MIKVEQEGADGITKITEFEANPLYIRLRILEKSDDLRIKFSKNMGNGVILDFNRNDEVVGIEIL